MSECLPYPPGTILETMWQGKTYRETVVKDYGGPSLTVKHPVGTATIARQCILQAIHIPRSTCKPRLTLSGKPILLDTPSAASQPAAVATVPSH